MAIALIFAGVCQAQDARSIVARAVAADDRSDRLARYYTYKVQNEIVQLDKAGSEKSRESTLDEVLYIAGKRYLHPLEKNGKPLPEPDQRKEQAKLDRAVQEAGRLSSGERARRIAEAEQDRARRREEFRDIPDAFDFRLAGDGTVDGREVWRIEAHPRRTYHGKLHAILNNVEGTLWIDKADFIWVRFDADVLNPFSIGLFLARVAQGSHISWQMMRVNNELWVPQTVVLDASARLMLMKKLNVKQRITFSDYRKFSTDSQIVSSEAEP